MNLLQKGWPNLNSCGPYFNYKWLLHTHLYIFLPSCSFANSDGGGDALRYLHSYCYMHRLFLELISQHQSLVSSAKESLKNFLSDPAKRHVDVSQCHCCCLGC